MTPTAIILFYVLCLLALCWLEEQKLRETITRLDRREWRAVSVVVNGTPLCQVIAPPFGELMIVPSDGSIVERKRRVQPSPLDAGLWISAESDAEAVSVLLTRVGE